MYGPRSDKFVCLDDVTGHPELMNYVIYRPTKEKNIKCRKDLLYRTIRDGVGLELSNKQLTSLTKYEVHDLDDFVSELSKIIEQYHTKNERNKK